MITSHQKIEWIGNANLVCPGCGNSNFESNRIDLALYRAAAREAQWLRFQNRQDEAVAVLTAYYGRRIVNFLLPAWRCLDCGVAFDD